MIWLWCLFILGTLSSTGLAAEGDGLNTQNTPPVTTSATVTASETTSSGSTASSTLSEGISTTTATPPPTQAAPTTTTVTPKPETTTDDNTNQDAVETAKLIDILNSPEGKFIGNREYTQWIMSIRDASKWGKNQLQGKRHIREKFEAYNTIRLGLEHKIQERIDELDVLIPQQRPNSNCSNFYQQQKSRLKTAFTLPNIEKQQRLSENSNMCPYGSNDCDDDYYYDYPLFDLIDDYYSDEYY